MVVDASSLLLSSTPFSYPRVAFFALFLDTVPFIVKTRAPVRRVCVPVCLYTCVRVRACMYARVGKGVHVCLPIGCAGLCVLVCRRVGKCTCLLVCVCVCTCMSVCACVCMSVCLFAGVSFCLPVRRCMRMYGCCGCVCPSVCMYVCTYVCMYACTVVCMYACTVV